ncbi:MAG: hypothetical protein U1E70_27560 [Acetobacteraceae bacterium]
MPAYRHFAYNLSHLFDWAAFIDIDEFLLPLDELSIRPVLQDCAGFSAVTPCWRVFSASGWETPPKGLMLDHYDRRAPDVIPVNAHMKSIVRCTDLLDVTANPHEFVLKGPVCNPIGEAVPNIAIQPESCHQRLVINHYVTRSRQDWMAKIHRGSAAVETGTVKYHAGLFDHYTEICSLRDGGIKRFVPAVRALLAGSPTPQAPQTDAPDRSLSVSAHVAIVGGVDGAAGTWIGKRGGGLWIEGITLRPGGRIRPDDIELRILLTGTIQSLWTKAGTFCGSKGLSRPMRGVAVRLVGDAANRYVCSCRATFTDGSSCGPVGAEIMCATQDLSPLEALRIDLAPRM